ncbi:hypothetical protein KAT08_03615 [Candidatus Babeliales bacterium]|nr:hypothetical protein [Candidatus Babeliales bacterium]
MKFFVSLLMFFSFFVNCDVCFGIDNQQAKDDYKTVELEVSSSYVTNTVKLLVAGIAGTVCGGAVIAFFLKYNDDKNDDKNEKNEEINKKIVESTNELDEKIKKLAGFKTFSKDDLINIVCNHMSKKYIELRDECDCLRDKYNCLDEKYKKLLEKNK